MELTPDSVNVDKIKEKIEKIPEVDYVDDLHCWSLAGGKNVLTTHIYLKRSGDSESENSPSNNDIHKVYQEVNEIVQRYHICHSTIQVLWPRKQANEIDCSVLLSFQIYRIFFNDMNFRIKNKK